MTDRPTNRDRRTDGQTGSQRSFTSNNCAFYLSFAFKIIFKHKQSFVLKICGFTVPRPWGLKQRRICENMENPHSTIKMFIIQTPKSFVIGMIREIRLNQLYKKNGRFLQGNMQKNINILSSHSLSATLLCLVGFSTVSHHSSHVLAISSSVGRSHPFRTRY